jgi:hypothetical protein
MAQFQEIRLMAVGLADPKWKGAKAHMNLLPAHAGTPADFIVNEFVVSGIKRALCEFLDLCRHGVFFCGVMCFAFSSL